MEKRKQACEETSFRGELIAAFMLVDNTIPSQFQLHLGSRWAEFHIHDGTWILQSLVRSQQQRPIGHPRSRRSSFTRVQHRRCMYESPNGWIDSTIIVYAPDNGGNTALFQLRVFDDHLLAGVTNFNPGSAVGPSVSMTITQLTQG